MGARRRDDDDGETTEEKGKGKGAKGLSGTKMIIRNVAFEATKRDLSQLFSPFGQLKSLRVPRKFDGSHRGFAFIEFVTKKEAANAYDAVRASYTEASPPSWLRFSAKDLSGSWEKVTSPKEL